MDADFILKVIELQKANGFTPKQTAEFLNTELGIANEQAERLVFAFAFAEVLKKA